MKKPAGALVDCIFAMSKDTSITRNQFREALFRLLIGEFKAGCQPFNVPLRDYDVVIRTAVAGTLRAVVEDRELSINHMI